MKYYELDVEDILDETGYCSDCQYYQAYDEGKSEEDIEVKRSQEIALKWLIGFVEEQCNPKYGTPLYWALNDCRKALNGEMIKDNIESYFC